MRFLLCFSIFFSPFVFARSIKPVPQDPMKPNWNCAVVEVTSENDHLFEEGLGSIYDIADHDGEPNTDEDSATADLDFASRNRQISFGQVTWEESQIEKVQHFKTHEEKTVFFVTLKKGAEPSEEQFYVRVYLERKLMRLFAQKAKGALRLVATADCSGLTDPRNR